MPWNLQYCLRNFWEEGGGRWGLGGGSGERGEETGRHRGLRAAGSTRTEVASEVSSRQVGDFWDQGGLGSLPASWLLSQGFRNAAPTAPKIKPKL